MDFGSLLLIGMAILGVAMIAGGIVAYRIGKATTAKVLGAAAVAGGAMMLLAVIWLTPISRTTGPSDVNTPIESASGTTK